ncbi:MAG: hypothetical protein AAGF44_03675 [Pseudomonadota bacterium]
MFFGPRDLSFDGPAALPLKRRNTAADWAFYDISNLNEAEFEMLVAQRNTEGSILAVKPSSKGTASGITKHQDHAALKSAKGKMLEHFTIAGVGSSDVGAASLARSLADHLGKPVGAIVAGYGVSDLLQEALGGWFFFGAANRAQAWMDRLSIPRGGETAHSVTARAQIAATLEPAQDDTRTLLRLLIDPDRTVRTLLGHSKGCLSIAFALNHVRDNAGPGEFDQFTGIEVITTGAVSEVPREMTSVRQYLGALDWFGGMNSVVGTPFIRVPNAWHHVNTDLPFHMDLGEVLSGAYD